MSCHFTRNSMARGQRHPICFRLSIEPCATSQCPRDTQLKPRATSQSPRDTQSKPRATSQSPRATSQSPRATSQSPRSTTLLGARKVCDGNRQTGRMKTPAKPNMGLWFDLGLAFKVRRLCRKTSKDTELLDTANSCTRPPICCSPTSSRVLAARQ